MEKRLITIVAAFLIAVLVGSSFLIYTLNSGCEQTNQTYIGVAFCGDTFDQAKLLIDRVKNYSNLFILQSGPISVDEKTTIEICDYAVNQGLNIIVYFGDLSPRVLAARGLEWRTRFVNSAKERYGEQFLGIYYYDEMGGLYLDANLGTNNWTLPVNATYSSVARLFVNGFLREGGTVALKNASMPMYTSDYALYWFDYLAGYDVLFAQVGWNDNFNYSLTQDISLIRGAARMQNKEWGVIITWKYDQPPYLDTGEVIYQQMLSSYQAGAKYITIFNYPYDDVSSYGIMADEHFEALERLWDTVVHKKVGIIKADAVLVLPKDYGFGMRNPQDTIWGIWGPDENTQQVWDNTRVLHDRYGVRLDIIYDNPNYPLNGQYKHVYFWNSTIG